MFVGKLEATEYSDTLHWMHAGTPIQGADRNPANDEMTRFGRTRLNPSVLRAVEGPVRIALQLEIIAPSSEGHPHGYRAFS